MTEFPTREEIESWGESVGATVKTEDNSTTCYFGDGDKRMGSEGIISFHHDLERITATSGSDMEIVPYNEGRKVKMGAWAQSVEGVELSDDKIVAKTKHDEVTISLP